MEVAERFRRRLLRLRSAQKDNAYSFYMDMRELLGESHPQTARAWQEWQDANGKEARAQDHLLALVINGR